MSQRGFSLVELSIVLVILGLLVGGILAGQSLIRAAELRSISAEYQRYSTAIYSFRDKYFALPGDFRDATRFWLRQSATNCVTNSAATTNSAGGCDGDGDGFLESGGAGAGANEQYQFWRHLVLAGLAEGTYTGQSGAAFAGQGVIGSNMPPSRAGNTSGWSAMYTNFLMTNHFAWTNNNYGNALWLGKSLSASTPYGYFLKPEDAWNIDTKLDDGKPQQGKLWAIFWDDCTTAASAAAINGEYDLQQTTAYCALVFPNAM